MISCFGVPETGNAYGPDVSGFQQNRVFISPRKNKRLSAVDRLLALEAGMSLIELRKASDPPKSPNNRSHNSTRRAVGNKLLTCVQGTDEETLDLPDGSCFDRITLLSLVSGKQCTIYNLVSQEYASRECQYLGSFPVIDTRKAENIWHKLDHWTKNVVYQEEGKKVLLLISVAGLKICRPHDQVVLMTHALRHISLATCDPAKRCFSFIAREPNSTGGRHLYCHTFRTSTPAQAEELSRLLGNAFRMAYAHQLQPAFLELLGQSSKVVNNQQQQVSRESQLGSSSPTHFSRNGQSNTGHETGSKSSTTTPSSSPAPTDKVWAKRAVPKHHEPLFAGLRIQQKSPVEESPHAVRPTRLQQEEGQRPQGGAEAPDLWSPSSTSSCEDNTKLASPTHDDHNSCSQVREKPPLVKTLHEAWTRPCSRNGFGDLAPSAPNASPENSRHQRRAGQAYRHGAFKSEADDGTSSSGATDPEASNSTQPDQSQRIASPRRQDVRPRLLQVSLPSSSSLENRSKSELSLDAPSSSCEDQEARSRLSASSSSCSSSSSEACGGKRVSSSSSSASDGSAPTTPCKKKGLAPSPPERMDSLSPQQEAEAKELREAPWFQAGIPREIALEILSQEPQGSFMVRESTTKPGCYALSLRVPRDFQPSGIAHYLIMRTAKGYKIKGFTKEFSTLTSLITHHSVMPELLPCALSLSRYNPVYRKTDTSQDLVDIEQDPDYNLLADFRKVMATPDLKV